MENNTQEIITEFVRLHTKPVYDKSDIMALEGCSSDTATKLMCKLRRDFGGAILSRPYAVRADAYYAYCGWDYKEYLETFLGGLNAKS